MGSSASTFRDWLPRGIMLYCKQITIRQMYIYICIIIRDNVSYEGFRVLDYL